MRYFLWILIDGKWVYHSTTFPDFDSSLRWIMEKSDLRGRHVRFCRIDPRFPNEIPNFWQFSISSSGTVTKEGLREILH